MTKRIGVQEETYERLKRLKSPGQSFNGVIVELIKKSREPDRSDDFPDRPGVYLVQDEGEVLYVGQTTSIRKRVNQHIITNDPDVRIEYEIIENKEKRKKKERELINRYEPPLNKNHNPSRNEYKWRIILDE